MATNNPHSIAPVPISDNKGELEHVEVRNIDFDNKGIEIDDESRLIQEAIATSEIESKYGFVKLFKTYYPAAIYSMLLSSALIMEGFDTNLINNLYGQNSFIGFFGHYNAAGAKYIPSNWQAGINNSSQAGQIIGLLLNGWAQSRFGCRRVYMVGMVAMTATIFILVFAQNLNMLLAGNFLCGIPWGIFQVLTTAYAAEIVPPAMRGYLTSWVSMCWGLGGFLAAGILRGSLSISGNMGWKVPYILQWAWPVPLFLVAFLAPESPYYLVRRGRFEEAEKVIWRLAKKGHMTDRMVKAQLALMKHTNELEKIDAANASYADSFSGTNRRRTEIGIMAWVTQILNGAHLGSYATVFLRAAGMPQSMAFNYSVGIQSTNIVGTAAAMYVIGRVDRRKFYLTGIAGLGVVMFVIGILGVVPVPANDVAIGIAVMMIMANIGFKLSLGPSCYTIVAEMPSSRVRSQTMVIGRAAYVVGAIIVNQLIPRMINKDAWNWGAKCGFFWMAFDIILFTYMYFRLPETRNRTFVELDYLFQKKLPARQFKKYDIDTYELSQVTHESGPGRVVELDNQAQRAPEVPIAGVLTK